MTIFAGRFNLKERGRSPSILQCQCLKFATGEIANFPKVSGNDSPALYLVPLSAVESLCLWENVVEYKGRKHPDINLYKYFSGGNKIPLLEGVYRKTGKIEQSIRSFLLKVAKERPVFNAHKAFLLAIDDSQLCTVLGKVDSSFVEQLRTANQDFSIETMTKGCGVTGVSPSLSSRQNRSTDLASVLYGESPQMVSIREQILLAGEHTQIILLNGETGTGKGLAARAIHDYSSRSEYPFTTFACGSVAGTLFESELFGHVRGAFTGADSDRKGLWQEAENGTLFLDEIGELPLDQQVKLLDVLERSVIRPVGNDREQSVNARLIFATNQDLDAMVQQRVFRDDLYWRIRHITIEMPTLRAQREYIPFIAERLWDEICCCRDDQPLSQEILDKLAALDWPGNVRALKAVLRSLYYQNVHKRTKNLEDLQGILHVMHLNQKEPCACEEAIAGNEVDLHRIKCLQHLKRAEEWVRSCQKIFEPYTLKDIDSQLLTKIDSLLLRNRLEQVCGLIGDPLLFYKEDSFMLINSLHGKFVYFNELVEKELWEDAGDYLSREMTPAFAQAQTLLFNSVESLLS